MALRSRWSAARIELASIARIDLEFVPPVAQISGELLRVAAAKAGVTVQLSRGTGIHVSPIPRSEIRF